jgi:NadR type nicotinamide-nucleotide adenylyltransferase
VTRVVVTGPDCTGKTTLASALATRHRTIWSPEFARQYVDRVGRPLTADDVEPIALGQLAAEDAAASQARGLLVLDTDLVSTCVYSRHYYRQCPPWLEALARSRLADLYLLLGVDVPWLPDGLMREEPERREELYGRFRRTLRRWNAPVVEIHGDWDERRARAFEAVGELLRSRGSG